MSGQKTQLFIGGIAHLGNGEVIQNAAISIKNDTFDFGLKNQNMISYFKKKITLFVQLNHLMLMKI